MKEQYIEHAVTQVAEQHEELMHEMPEAPEYHSKRDFILSEAGLDIDNLPTGKRIRRNSPTIRSMLQSAIHGRRFDRQYEEYERQLEGWREDAARSAINLSGVLALVGATGEADDLMDEARVLALPEKREVSSGVGLARLAIGEGTIFDAFESHEELFADQRMYQLIDIYKLLDSTDEHRMEILRSALAATSHQPFARLELMRQALKDGVEDEVDLIQKFELHGDEVQSQQQAVKAAMHLERARHAREVEGLDRDMWGVRQHVQAAHEIIDKNSEELQAISSKNSVFERAIGHGFIAYNSEAAERAIAFKALVPLLETEIYKDLLREVPRYWPESYDKKVLQLASFVGDMDVLNVVKDRYWEDEELAYQIYRGFLEGGSLLTAAAILDTLPTRTKMQGVFDLIVHLKDEADLTDDLPERLKDALGSEQRLLVEIDALLHDRIQQDDWSWIDFESWLEAEMSDGLETRDSLGYGSDIHRKIKNVEDKEERKKMMEALRNYLDSDRRGEVERRAAKSAKAIQDHQVQTT